MFISFYYTTNLNYVVTFTTYTLYINIVITYKHYFVYKICHMLSTGSTLFINILDT